MYIIIYNMEEFKEELLKKSEDYNKIIEKGGSELLMKIIKNSGIDEELYEDSMIFLQNEFSDFGSCIEKNFPNIFESVINNLTNKISEITIEPQDLD